MFYAKSLLLLIIESIAILMYWYKSKFKLTTLMFCMHKITYSVLGFHFYVYYNIFNLNNLQKDTFPRHSVCLVKIEQNKAIRQEDALNSQTVVQSQV